MTCPKCKKGKIRVLTHLLGQAHSFGVFLGAADARYAFCDGCYANFIVECAKKRRPSVFAFKLREPIEVRDLTASFRRSARDSRSFLSTMMKRSVPFEKYRSRR